MNINKKGFTLIELIITIALLAIISTISFVSISGMLKESKISDCKNLIGNIKTAATEYVSDNRYNREFVDNVTNYKVTINAKTLIDGKYINNDIKNPITNETITPSSITITIELYNNYTAKNISVEGIDCSDS